MVSGLWVVLRRARTWTMVLGPRVRGWVPVRTAVGWRRVEGSLVVGGAAGLVDEGWRAVGGGRVVMMIGVCLLLWCGSLKEEELQMGGKCTVYCCFPQSYPND